MRTLLSSVAFGAIAAATPAFAADLPVKAPRTPAPAAVAASWTGFYVGANLGLSVARNPTEFLAFTFPGSTDNDDEHFNLGPIGVVGGGQIAYNWQIAPSAVWGLEADFQGSGERDSTVCVTECTPNGALSTKFNQRLPWFGTLRGRIGWANGPALFYATGGLAYGKVTTEFVTVASGSSAAGSFSQVKAGWTAGAGIEAQIAGNWTGKIEYLYMDLGTVDGATAGTGQIAPFGFAFSSRVQDHIVRAGVNYKFGTPVYAAASPAGIYKAPVRVPAVDWSGFYVGANVGLSVARNQTSAFEFFPGSPIDINEQVNLSPVGAVGGGQIGYNLQTGTNLLLGVEADFQASGAQDSTTCIFHCNPRSSAATSETLTQKLPWFGTVRGRVGWTDGPVLFYGTGGWAYGKITTDMNVSDKDVPAIPPTIASGSFSQVKSGWTAGAGVEAQLFGNWTGKLEYLYMDLGTVTGAATGVGGDFAGQVSGFSSRIQDHVVRVGLNYKFGATPLVAKY